MLVKLFIIIILLMGAGVFMLLYGIESRGKDLMIFGGLCIAISAVFWLFHIKGEYFGFD